MPVSSVSRNSPRTPRSTSTPILRQGSNGASVRTLQTLLRQHGANISVDGDFGPRTAAAVKAFQAKHHLTADGIVGPRTWAALRSGGSRPASSSGSSGTPVLRLGAHGAAVTDLQRLLRSKGHRISADGDFGPATLSAVKSFQRSHGLAADGVVGPRTWAALRGSGGSTAPSNGGGGAGTAVVGYQNGRRTTVRVVSVGSGEYMNVRCAQAYKNMLAAARRAGVFLGTTDGYRTYAEQAALYRRYGPPRAARPGYSNHQMGIAADISGVNGYNTRAYRWLRANAGRYGFVNNVRGEYWHWTYVR